MDTKEAPDMSMEMMEQDEDSWTRFVSTGRVEDYLKYRTELKNNSSYLNSTDKERNDGRESYIYGNDSDGITDERIR